MTLNPTKRMAAAGGFTSPLDHGAALLFWWDAAQGVVQGTPPDVDSWTDAQSGIIATEPAVVPPTFEASSLNGQPGINFDPTGATSTRLIAPPATAINNIWTKGSLTTLWTVVQSDALSGFGEYFIDKGWNTANSGWALLGLGTGIWRWRQRSAGGDIERDTATTFPAGNPYYVQVDWTGAMNVLPVVRVNGTLESFTNPAAGTGAPADDSAVNMVIGNRDPGGGNNFHGRIHEIYATVDSAIDPAEDEAYIKGRWGFP